MRSRASPTPITYGFYFLTHIALVHRRTRKYDFDPQDDLIDQLHLDKGRIYRDLEKQSRFGFLPAMASCSTGQIGALMAESFCERILSCAKQVVHSARLSYKAEEYSMVVILRMNRAFMEYMRKHEKDYEPGK